MFVVTLGSEMVNARVNAITRTWIKTLIYFWHNLACGSELLYEEGSKVAAWRDPVGCILININEQFLHLHASARIIWLNEQRAEDINKEEILQL